MVRKCFLLLIISPIFFFSCTTFYTEKDHYYEIDQFVEEPNFNLALSELEAIKNRYYSDKDKVLYYIEEGMLQRFAGNYNKSNESLTKAENYIDEMLKISISKNILSGVLNDNALDYTGEDYENIYINIYKSLNYFHLGNITEALVEIRKVNFKLDVLEKKYASEINNINNYENADIPTVTLNFYNDAFARYIGVIAYRLENLLDDARIEQDNFEKSFSLQKNIYNFSKPKSPILKSDKSIINLFSYTGFAPEKVPETVYITNSGSFLYLSSKNNFIGFNRIRYRPLDNYISLKLQFPNLQNQKDPVKYVEVLIDKISYGYMTLLEDFDNIANSTFRVKQPLIVGKTVLRAVSKTIATEISENAIKENFGEGFGLLASLVGEVYKNVTENSDLRTSRYLPSKIRSLEIEIEPGFHDISIIYYSNNKSVLYQEDYRNKEIKSEELNLFESVLMRKL